MGSLSSQGANRARILQLVHLLPGLHLRELQRLLHISFSSTRYNVGSLTRSGEVVCERSGKYSRLFPAMSTDGERAFYTLLRGGGARAILSALGKGSALTHREISEMTGLAKSTVSEHVQALLTHGVVRTIYSEGRLKVELMDAANVLAVLNREVRMVDRLVNNFVELWDS
jgi:predicted transcriptional regulator